MFVARKGIVALVRCGFADRPAGPMRHLAHTGYSGGSSIVTVRRRAQRRNAEPDCSSGDPAAPRSDATSMRVDESGIDHTAVEREDGVVRLAGVVAPVASGEHSLPLPKRIR